MRSLSDLVFNHRLFALHLHLPAAKGDALLHPSHVWMGTKARWLRGGSRWAEEHLVERGDVLAHAGTETSI